MRIELPVTAPLAVLAALIAGNPAQGTETALSRLPRSDANAGAASFDCAHATSVRDKVICADPALSALDGQLGRLYRQRRALLSPHGAELLQLSERSWLRFVGTVCSPDGPEKQAWKARASCLQNQYHDRIKQLGMVAQQIGPYLFNRIDLFSAQPSGDDTGMENGFYIQHAAYPQIDNANSALLQTWNQQNVRQLPIAGDCGPGDHDVDFEVGLATPRFISVQWESSTYCHGTAHGFWDVKAVNTVLSPDLRTLTAEDVFGPDRAWAPILKARFWTALTQMGWSPPDNQPDVQQELEDAFIRPERWLFTKTGLQIAFSAYEGGCYACTPQPVTVPWAALKPLLSKASIAR